MHTRQLGKNGPRVSAIGLGCMGMTDFYTPGSDTTEATATLHRALELGVNFLDTADMYGPHTNEQLIGKAIAGKRDQVFLASKFGIVRDPANPALRGVNGRPEYIRDAINGTLQRLGRTGVPLATSPGVVWGLAHLRPHLVDVSGHCSHCPGLSLPPGSGVDPARAGENDSHTRQRLN